LRASCGLRGLLISWFIVGILTNPIEHDNRPTAKRAPGGSLSRPTECTPSRQGAVPILPNRAAFRWHPTASREAADTREATLPGQAEYPLRSAECGENLAAGLDRLGGDQHEGDDARLGTAVDPVVHGAALDHDIAGLQMG